MSEPMEKKEKKEEPEPESAESNKAAIAAAGFFNLVGRMLSKLLKLSRIYWRQITAVVVVLLLVFFIYGYFHTKHQLDQASDTKAAQNATAQDLTKKIGKTVQLPTGETPTVATVKDASKLKNQAFFSDAKNGDKVLIYSHAARAVLYRPSTNKVIMYSFINLNGSGQ